MNKTNEIHLNIVFKKNENDAKRVEKALQTLAKNITPDNLVLLSEKSCKIGINQKIKAFKNLM